jgi:hypothetical protein
MPVVIGIDQSASIDSEKNSIGYAIFVDGELSNFGEMRPDFPHFYENRKWLADLLIGFGCSKTCDCFVALETVFLKRFVNKQGGSSYNPELFKRLISAKEHLHAVASDLLPPENYMEITPQESAKAVGAVYSKGGRKEAVMEAVRTIYPKVGDISEHEADAIALGVASLKRLSKEENK